ncbi:metallophosphoesterase [Patescibacteria group bacterium]|nr:metallophosphoesterase [Patescibacteria group bacterium]MBU1457451.1 metallophosphoesterase [Patescibacteria group bacterium]
MKIHILSDIHNEFEEFKIPKTDADILILAGDIHVGAKGIDWITRQDVGVPVLYIIGNHEYYHHTYPDILEEIRNQAKNTNIHILENDVFTYNGVNFLGCTLWTDFKLYGDFHVASVIATQQINDFRIIRMNSASKKFSPLSAADAYYKSKNWLSRELLKRKHEKNVVITHHAPSMQSIGCEYKNDVLSASFASNLEEFILSHNIQLWIHGHVHTKLSYKIGDTKIVCNSRGYPQENIKIFNPCYCEIV